MRFLERFFLLMVLMGLVFFCALAEQTTTPAATKTPVPTATPRPTNTPVPTGTPDPVLYTDVRGVFDQVEGEDQKVLLSFLGDVTLGCNEIDHNKKRSIDYYIDSYGYEYPFYRVKYVLEQDDLTIANFEGIVQDTQDGLTKQTKKTYNFRAPVSYIDIIKYGSVEAVGLGNNHSGDYGQPGFESTVKVLEENGIEWFGSTPYSAKGFIYEKGNAKIGFVSAYISYYWQNVEAVQSLMQEMKDAGCSPLIAIIHGGVEYDTKHDKNQTNMAKKFISWGADLVIGHHPHCLQGYEVIDDVPVFYSLGNFVFGGNFNLKTKYTCILQCALSFDENGQYMGYQFNILPCRLSSDETANQYQPYLCSGRQAELAVKELQNDTKKAARLNGYTEGVGALQPYVSVIQQENEQIIEENLQ